MKKKIVLILFVTLGLLQPCTASDEELLRVYVDINLPKVVEGLGMLAGLVNDDIASVMAVKKIVDQNYFVVSVGEVADSKNYKDTTKMDEFPFGVKKPRVSQLGFRWNKRTNNRKNKLSSFEVSTKKGFESSEEFYGSKWDGDFVRDYLPYKVNFDKALLPKKFQNLLADQIDDRFKSFASNVSFQYEIERDIHHTAKNQWVRFKATKEFQEIIDELGSFTTEEQFHLSVDKDGKRKLIMKNAHTDEKVFVSEIRIIVKPDYKDYKKLLLPKVKYIGTNKEGKQVSWLKK